MTARFFQESSFDDLFPADAFDRGGFWSENETESDRPESGTGVVELAVEHPHAVAFPEGYEPGYAYPLIVWLPPAGQTEHNIQSVLPQISERNYLAVALRGNVAESMGYGWHLGDPHLELARQFVADAVDSMCRRYRIHQQRIYVAGVGMGGTLATRLLLEHPERFAGAISLNGDFPHLAQPLRHFRALRGKRVLLSNVMADGSPRIAQNVNSGRLLYQAGVDVGTRVYQPSAGINLAKQLRDIDHWIMDGIRTAVRI